MRRTVIETMVEYQQFKTRSQDTWTESLTQLLTCEAFNCIFIWSSAKWGEWLTPYLYFPGLCWERRPPPGSKCASLPASPCSLPFLLLQALLPGPFHLLSHRFCSLILDIHFHAGSHKQFTNICAIFNNLLQCMNKKHIITFLHCQVLNKWSLISFGSWTSLMVWWNQLYPPRKTHIYKHFCTKKFWCLLPNMEGPWSSS